MDIKDLLGKSLLSLNMEELETLKAHYEKDRLTYFEKIESVEKAIRRLQAKLNKPVERPQWEYDALEYIALTEKWESLGAYWSMYNDWKTQWFYNDVCFYEWTKSSRISDNIVEARESDKFLMNLLESKNAM